MTTGKVTGLDTVMKNLNKEISGIRNRSLKGLIRAQIVIRRDMDTTSPTIPVQYGNLRASYYAVTANGEAARGGKFKGDNAGKLASGHSEAISNAHSLAKGAWGKGPLLIMGFSAFYAWFVHEMVGAVNWTRDGSGAKFLEAAIKNTYDKILSIIRDEAKVKK